MKKAKHTFLVLAVISLMAAVAAWSEAKQPNNSSEIMDLTDLNGDGKIDLEEYTNRIADVYFFLDTDKDDKLTVVEIQKSMPKLGPDILNKADVNGDKIITIYEFQHVLQKDFDVMDKNNDGSLDKQEIQKAIEEK